MRTFLMSLMFATGLGVTLVLAVGWGGYAYFSRDLPDYSYLRNYEPPTTTRVYAGNGGIIGEFAIERRIFVPIDMIPVPLIQAFLAAEDSSFYRHNGIDFLALGRALWQNIGYYMQDRRLVGASTITQQVAKNFLVGNERRLERKIREAILAIHLERALGKQRILELYLNEIYLGEGAYGVAAAANVFFRKNLRDLSLEEMALLSALPKAPSRYSPFQSPQIALERRNWVLNNMERHQFISRADSVRAQRLPIRVASSRRSAPDLGYGYISAEVRNQFKFLMSKEDVLESGAVVRTSIDTNIQDIAVQALRDGLEDYDRRHGYRGSLGTLLSPHHVNPSPSVNAPEDNTPTAAGEISIAPSLSTTSLSPTSLSPTSDQRSNNSTPLPTDPNAVTQYHEALRTWDRHPGMLEGWVLAVVTNVENDRATVVIEDNPTPHVILRSDTEWARRHLSYSDMGSPITSLLQVFNPGDVVIVSRTPYNLLAPEQSLPASTPTQVDLPENPSPDRDSDLVVFLRQLPDIDGGMLVLDPHQGRILAMVGGWSFKKSQFNRVTQAYRQPGSAVKPFVYMTAVDQGFTPLSSILDAPFVIRRGLGAQETWKPFNFEDSFLGMQPLRVGLERSLNLMTIRLANGLGMDKVGQTFERMGILDYAPNTLAHALGAGETSLMRLTMAYGALVNGGKKVQPQLISHIQDRYGRVIYRADRRECATCQLAWQLGSYPPKLKDQQLEQIANPRSAFQIVHMLRGAVLRGTGRQLATLPFPVSGKTGTSNNLQDVWFIGMLPDMVVGVYMGFDTPSSLGRRSGNLEETASITAASVVRNFLARTLEGRDPSPFPVPAGISMVIVDPKTNKPTTSGRGIEIAMKSETLSLLDPPEQNLNSAEPIVVPSEIAPLAPLDIGPEIPEYLRQFLIIPPTPSLPNEAAFQEGLSPSPPRQSPIYPSQNQERDPEKIIEQEIY